MRYRWKSFFVIAAVTLSPVTSVRAQYFPSYSSYPSTLDNRANILLAPPGNGFDFEVKWLVEKPPNALLSVEGPDMEAQRFHDVKRTVGTYSYTTPEFITKDVIAREKFEHDHLSAAQLVALKAARDTTSAAEAYVAGEGLPLILQAYTAGAVAYENNDFKEALTRFSNAQATGDAEPGYSLWVTYMLGRTAANLANPDDAQKSFVAVRNMVIAGAPDPLGLAVASYGEEARLALDKAGGVLGEGNFNPDQAGRQQHFLDAIRLYALQAEAGSKNGLDSLHILAKDIKNVPSDFTLMMQDELARRLFLAYVRGYDGPRGGVQSRQEFITSMLPFFSADDKDIADQLAAAAYEIGSNDLAKHYAEQKADAYSTWVSAKLALRAGDHEKAAVLYENAFQQAQHEIDHPSIDPDTEMMADERAILTLVRGQYVRAFEEFYPLQVDGDTTFMAERILTIDELQHFVDANVPETATVEPDPSASIKTFTAIFRARDLRTQLAQRLMRMSKERASIPYFLTRDRDTATKYLLSLDEGRSSSNSIEKATGFYKAAIIERASGDNLYGQALIKLAAPDVIETDSSFTTQGERERLAASRAETSLPPSFRRVATAEALEAADLLPPRSQAFAATLCQATNWMIPIDEDEADSYYQRYVEHGAVVPWATHFGHHCPEPDFDAAQHFQIKHFLIRIRHKLSHHILLGTLAIIVILGIGGMIYRRRLKMVH